MHWILAKLKASWKLVGAGSGFLPSVRLGMNRLLDKQFMALDVPIYIRGFGMSFLKIKNRPTKMVDAH